MKTKQRRHNGAHRVNARSANIRATISTNSESETVLYQTLNDIPEQKRTDLIPMLNQRLAEMLDLQLQMKQAHWNVKGPEFISLHELFDKIAVDVTGYVDLIAERAVQLGGIAEGTAQVIMERTALPGYPLNIAEGPSHVDAVCAVLALCCRDIRKSIDEAEALGDAGTMDMFTGISRGLDKWLWFVEAHLQAPA